MLVPVPAVTALIPLPNKAYEPTRLPALQEGEDCRTNLIKVLDPYSVLTVGAVGPPVQVPVIGPVLVVEQTVPVVRFCNNPKSISDPSRTTTPCRVVLLVLFPNASRSVIVMVQSDEFTVKVPTRVVAPPRVVGLAKMFPDASRNRSPDEANGAVFATPPSS